MDAELIGKLQNLYSITHIPLSLLDGSGRILATFPAMSFAVVDMGTTQMVLEDFRLQKRDSAHPLISYMEPGFFWGSWSCFRSCICSLVLSAPCHGQETTPCV